MTNKESPIGVFDSGLGGLTALRAIYHLMPHESLVYFGDTARVPYGSKSTETIVRYSLEILEFLKSKHVKTVVVACNTASALAMDQLQEKSDIPIIGMVEPGVMVLAQNKKKSDKAAVIATRSTIKSNAYEKALRKMEPTINLYSKACPLLVPLIEEGFTNKRITELVLHEYLDEIQREGITDVILGCTHYPLLKDVIHRLYPEFRLIDSSEQLALALRALLTKRDMLTQESGKGQVSLYVSDITESLLDLEKLFFKETIHSLEKVSLGW